MLLACGSNGNGQLGLGHTEDVNDWTPVDIQLHGPISIAGGGNHTVIVEHTAGVAYISHNGSFVPIEHPLSEKWRLCAAGWAFTVLVDTQNDVWVFGSGSKGELGLKEKSVSELTKIAWNAPSEIVSIKSGMAHTVVCLADGSLWGWGASRKGQLNCVQVAVDRPVFITDGTGPSAYACGRDFTAVLRDSRLYILGNTRCFGTNEIEAPEQITVLAGWSSLLFIPSCKALGNNSHNQLDAPTKLDLVALGSEHGVYRVGTIVRTWGWGEHGNCPQELNIGTDASVYAGCATSFVYST